MSSPPVFLVDVLPGPGRYLLDGPEGRHAATVRRLRPGEHLVLTDGRGGAAECVVEGLRPGAVDVEVQTVRTEPAPEPRLVVVQGLAKGDAGELAVTQLTEVGVDEVLPWQAGRSVVRWDGPRGQKAVGRWTSAAREATKQARRSWLPVIGPVATTVDVVARLRAAAVGLVLHEGAEAPLAWAPLPAVGEVVVVVGPEGGVDPAELDSFLAAGAQAVRLGRTVLRSSTAGTAALSVLAARVGRWG